MAQPAKKIQKGQNLPKKGYGKRTGPPKNIRKEWGLLRNGQGLPKNVRRVKNCQNISEKVCQIYQNRAKPAKNISEKDKPCQEISGKGKACQQLSEKGRPTKKY